METPEIIRELAALRLEEAEILVQNNKPDGAFYLAGYSVELALKAKIAERLGLPGLFDSQNNGQQQAFGGIKELRNLVRTHNLTLLLVISGLRADFERKCATEISFGVTSYWLNDWNEGLRYRSPGSVTRTGVEQFLLTLAGPSGLLKWIEQH